MLVRNTSDYECMRLNNARPSAVKDLQVAADESGEIT